MYRLLFVLPLVCILPGFATADEASDLRDRALKAYAKDPANLKKIRVHTLKAKGISNIGPAPVPAEFELSASWPGHLKATWQFGAGANKRVVTMCGADDRGWKKVEPAMAIDMSVEELNDFRADAYAVWVSTLTTLNDAANKLSMEKPTMVMGDAVVGLKVSRAPWPDVSLFFDAKTNLLRKMMYRSREGGITQTKEMYYDGHKEAGGLMLPTRHTTMVKGQQVYTWTEMEYEFPEKLDAKVFKK